MTILVLMKELNSEKVFFPANTLANILWQYKYEKTDPRQTFFTKEDLAYLKKAGHNIAYEEMEYPEDCFHS